MATYVPPACGLHLVSNVVPGRTFFGWRCAECDGPVYVSHALATAMTGHADETDDPIGFYHDMRSDHYWKESP